jgi:hypothetical protein
MERLDQSLFVRGCLNPRFPALQGTTLANCYLDSVYNNHSVFRTSPWGLHMAPPSACVILACTSVGCSPNSTTCFYMGRQSHHVRVTTLERLDQSSLHPPLEQQRQTCPGLGNPWLPATHANTLTKSYLDSLSSTIRNIYTWGLHICISSEN